MPERIQLRRTAGWRKPEGVVVVSRPTRWGNPWKAGSTSWTVLPGGLYDKEPHPPLTAEQAVESYRNSILADPDEVAFIRRELAGKSLACWCRTSDPCHGDVLLEIAAQPGEPKPVGPTIDQVVSEYRITALPEGHEVASFWTATVELCPGGRWTVCRGSRILNADGGWDHGSRDEQRTKKWQATHWFPLRKALALAREALPKVTLNGHTLADVLADEAVSGTDQGRETNPANRKAT